MGWKRILQTAVGLALPLVLLLGNVQLLAHPRFVRYEYNQADFPPDTRIPEDGYPLGRAERIELAERGVRSIIGSEGMRVLEEARFRETGTPAFNAREIQHMQDVRVIFQRARILFWVALAVLLGGAGMLAWWARHGNGAWQASAQPLLISVMVTLSLAVALGLYILLNFNNFFTQFHHLFFEGSTWLFRRDDTLIRLYPADFWFDAALIIAGLSIAELIIVGLGAWYWGRREADTAVT